MNPPLSTTSNNRWNLLHRIGGISAIIIPVLLIGEVFVYSLIPSPITPLEHIELFQQKPLLGLLHFDLLGMIAYLLFIPLILSLYIILRQHNESVSLVATVLFFVGISVFFATNTAFPVLSLSKQYALAETESQRMILVASCQTMITTFNVQAFMLSYVIVSASWTIIGLVMFRSKHFSRFIATLGIVAGATGIIAEIIENTSEALPGLAVALYFFALVFLFAWVMLTGRKLVSIHTE